MKIKLTQQQEFAMLKIYDSPMYQTANQLGIRLPTLYSLEKRKLIHRVYNPDVLREFTKDYDRTCIHWLMTYDGHCWIEGNATMNEPVVREEEPESTHVDEAVDWCEIQDKWENMLSIGE